MNYIYAMFYLTNCSYCISFWPADVVARRPHCNKGTGYPPIYVNVDMINGEMTNNWIDSLQAAWPGVQVGFCTQIHACMELKLLCLCQYAFNVYVTTS